MSKLFSFRVSRLFYWAALVPLWVVNGAIALVAAPLVIQVPVLVVSSLLWLLVVAGRFRDMGQSSWMALTTVVPFIGFFVALYAGFAKPTSDTPEDADNRGFAR